MDIAMSSRSETTGRFNFVIGADGDVSFDDTATHEVLTSATEAAASWWADPSHGCKIRSLKSLTNATPSQAEAMTLDSLSSLEAAGEISEVSVTATAERVSGQRTGRLVRRIRWTTPSGFVGDQRVGV